MPSAATVKIFKKSSPNGRVYLYLGNREYVSCDGAIKPVTGVVNIQVILKDPVSSLFSFNFK